MKKIRNLDFGLIARLKSNSDPDIMRNRPARSVRIFSQIDPMNAELGVGELPQGWTGFGIGRILLLFVVLFAVPSIHSEEVPRERKIFAHHMGSLNAGTGAMRWWTENMYRELGDPASSNGGPYRNLALAPYGKDIGIRAAADLDIRRALRIGVDGFAINAWAGGEQNRAFTDVLFEVAEENEYPFEITLSLDPATLGGGDTFTDPDGKPYPKDGPYGPAYQRAVNAIQYLLDHYGDSPNLARRDGKPLIFGYMSGYIGIYYAKAKYPDKTENEIRSNPWGWEAIAEGIRELENQVNQPLYLQFCMQALFHGVWNLQKTRYAEAAGIIAKHVDAVGEFLPGWIDHEGAPPQSELWSAAERVIAAGKEWSHPIFFQYENTKNNKVSPVIGTNIFNYSWSEVHRFSTLVQFTTWNDYHEASNLAPGVDTRYAAFDLASYYIDWWKTGVPPQYDKDKVYVFSRKYPSGAQTFPFRNEVFTDGAIDIVTILTEPAIIHLPNRGTYEAPAGRHSVKLPVTPGDITVELWRGGKRRLKLKHPEPVTDRPFRQDNGITAISTEFMRHWVADFGEGEPPFVYSEYGDADGDGLPNWFEMYYFGRFLDMATASVADPNEDVNGSGLTNLEEYLLQRNPVAPVKEQPVVTQIPISSLDTPSVGIPFHGEPAKIPGRIEAEDFDRGGQGVGYFETIWFNQGRHYRTGESVDICQVAYPHDPEGGGYAVNYTRTGEWLNYTVDVTESGYYDIRIRARAFWQGVGLSISFNGKNLTGDRELNIGVGSNWTSTIIRQVPLEAGVQVMQVRMKDTGVNAGIDLNFIEITPSEAPPTADIQVEVPDATYLIAGDSAVIRATPPTNNIGKMYFKVNGEVIGETTGPGWEMQWRNIEAGDHKIQIEAIGFPGGYHVSDEVTIAVAETRAAFPPAIQAWSEYFFSEEELADNAVVSLTADPDGDGFSNLLEYALGGDPNRASSTVSPVTTIVSEGDDLYLSLSFDRPRDLAHAVYEVQTSTDLWRWSPVEVSRYEILPMGDWENVTVRTLISTDETPVLFKRLKVTLTEAN